MNLSEIGQIITALGVLGTAALSWRNAGKIQEVHLSLNSRLDELLKEHGAAQRAAGAAQERSEQEKRGKETI
jgi:hypothetical protein